MTRYLLRVLASLCVTVLLLFFVFRELSFSEFSEIFSSFRSDLLFLFVALSVLSLVLRALRYKVLFLNGFGGDRVPSDASILIITAIRNALVDSLPARLGETSFLYVSKRYGVPLLGALGSLGLCTLLDISFLLLLLSVLFLFESASPFFAGNQFSLIAVLVPFSISVLFALYYLDLVLDFISRLLKKRSWENKYLLIFVAWLEEISANFLLLRSKQQYLRLSLLTLGLRVLKYLSLYVLTLAFIGRYGYDFRDVSPLLTTLAFVAAEASASLPLAGVMGFGAYELIWSTVFRLSGLEIPSITGLILAIHIASQFIGYTLGLVAGGLFVKHELRR